MQLSPTPGLGRSWSYETHGLGTQLFSAYIFLVAALAAAAILIGASHGVLRAGAAVLGVALIGVAVVRTRRIGVWADEQSVVVQNFFRTWGFAWSDVERVRPFTSGRSRSWQFELRDGRKISAQGIPLRGVYGETHRMVTVASRPVAIDSGSSRPDDF